VTTRRARASQYCVPYDTWAWAVLASDEDVEILVQAAWRTFEASLGLRAERRSEALRPTRLKPSGPAEQRRALSYKNPAPALPVGQARQAVP
jgi:hypothetical protein